MLDDKLKDVDPQTLPYWIPKLTKHAFTTAKAHVLRNEQILKELVTAPRTVRRISEPVIEMLFEFFSSKSLVQDMAYGTITGMSLHFIYLVPLTFL